MPLRCHPTRERDADVEPADKDGCAPVAFYSTTNQQTSVDTAAAGSTSTSSAWTPSSSSTAAAPCRKLREVCRGDLVVCGVDGIRVIPEFRERDRHGFAFMTNDISSERRVEVSVGKIAKMMREVRASGGRIAFVAGPVVIHTGGVEHFGELIRQGYVQVLLAGNAHAVHDAEFAVFGTSPRVDLTTGNRRRRATSTMRAINAIIRAGGIRRPSSRAC